MTSSRPARVTPRRASSRRHRRRRHHPHRAARRAAHRHRGDARRAQRERRGLGAGRLARRDAGAGRHEPLPRAPAVQGHDDPHRRWTSRSAMDAVGGEFNAFTEKEHTCFYATVLDRDLALAIDIVTDVVLQRDGHGAGRRHRAQRRARRDRDARRRPGRPRARRVRHRAVRRHPARAGRSSAPSSRSRALTRRADRTATTGAATRPTRWWSSVAGNVDHATWCGWCARPSPTGSTRRVRPYAPRRAADPGARPARRSP